MDELKFSDPGARFHIAQRCDFAAPSVSFGMSPKKVFWKMAIIAPVAFRTSVSRLIGVSFHEVKERERERKREGEIKRDEER